MGSMEVLKGPPAVHIHPPLTFDKVQKVAEACISRSLLCKEGPGDGTELPCVGTARSHER